MDARRRWGTGRLKISPRSPVGARQEEKMRKIGEVFSGEIPLQGSDFSLPDR